MIFAINSGGCFYPLVNKYNIFYFFMEIGKENAGVSLCEILTSALSIEAGGDTFEVSLGGCKVEGR